MKAVLQTLRGPFLILALSCSAVGLGTAFYELGYLPVPDALIAVLGALLAHVSVNTFNEYFDFVSGLDARTRRTPFSGGSGALPQHPELARYTLGIAWGSLALVGVIGIYFLLTKGWALLPIGLLGMLVIVLYTPWATRSPFLCLISAGLGFGPLMVVGTHVALTGHYSWVAVVASLVPFFLVSDLLLLNQFPDVEADKQVGRRHYPIVIGLRRSARIYVGFLAGAYVVVVGGVLGGVLPPATLLGLLTVVLAVPIVRRVLAHAEDLAQLMPALGLNVLVNLITPLLIALGFFVA